MSELRAENQLWDGKAAIDNRMVEYWDRKAMNESESREGNTTALRVRAEQFCHSTQSYNRELNRLVLR